MEVSTTKGKGDSQQICINKIKTKKQQSDVGIQ